MRNTIPAAITDLLSEGRVWFGEHPQTRGGASRAALPQIVTPRAEESAGSPAVRAWPGAQFGITEVDSVFGEVGPYSALMWGVND